MDFAFSQEQLLLRASARDWLQDHYPLGRVVELADSASGTDPQVWQQLSMLGWLDGDLTPLDTALLFEETGRALLPGPLFASVALGVPGADPSRPATLAWAEPGAPLLGDPVATRAERGRITGHKITVPDLSGAEAVNVVCADGIYTVDRAELDWVERSTLDRTRRLGEVRLAATPGERVAAPAAVAEIRRRAGVAAACEAVGVADRMLELARDHVGTREQFGRAIGSYQAVSHQVADMYVSVELARSLAYWAAWCVTARDEQADLAVAAATSAATAAARTGCERAIQVHGGSGFTWDSPIHRWYKRALWLEAFTGGGRAQRARIAATLLADR